MRLVIRMLNWIGKACNHLNLCRFYFINPPNENDAEEMRVYNERLKW